MASMSLRSWFDSVCGGRIADGTARAGSEKVSGAEDSMAWSSCRLLSGNPGVRK